MPIKLKVDFVDGWKSIENSRFGKVLVLRFVNTINNETLFEYAPKCNDKEFFMDFFNLLEKYDAFLMEYRVFLGKFGNEREVEEIK